MHSVSRIFVLPILLACTGCSSVTVSRPVGSPVPDDEVAKDYLDGAWISSDKRFLIHAKYVGDGKLVMAVLKWDKEQQRFNVEQSESIVREHKANFLIHTSTSVSLGEDGSKTTGFALMKCETEGDTMLVQRPASKFLADAVLNGQLKGVATPVHKARAADDPDAAEVPLDYSVHLTDSPEKIAEFLEENPQQSFGKPGVFLRVTPNVD